MVDSRGALPQEWAGGHAGLPCARWRPRSYAETLPELGLRIPKEKAFHLPGANADLRPEYVSFNGTHCMPWATARSRSTGALQPGGTLDKVLKLRKETDLDHLVDIIMKSAPPEPPPNFRHFKQPFNPYREQLMSKRFSEEDRRKEVLRALRRFPLCNVYDLASCSPRRWTRISRDLGGVSYGAVMRSALEHVQNVMTPMERASFWAAVGTRQRVVDHGRVCGFASDGFGGISPLAGDYFSSRSTLEP